MIKEHQDGMENVEGEMEKQPEAESSMTSEDKMDDAAEQAKNARKGSLSKKGNKPQLTPEEQELAYELKAQMMRTIDVQNTKLKTELALHDKMEEIRLTTPSHRNHVDECNLSKTNLVKLMRLYERKARDASNKITDLQQELQKTQFTVQKYQSLYESERRKGAQVAARRSSSQEDNREIRGSEVSTDSNHNKKIHHTPMMRPQSMAGYRFDDFQRRNEHLIIENEALKYEIIRLKKDNARLIQQTKHAESDRATMCHQLITSDMSRKDLLKRLGKEQKEHRQLNKSLTKQASAWLQHKKLAQQMGEEIRWNQVGPVSVLGAEDRTYAHKVTKNVYQPRMMMPVEKYATTSGNL